MENSESNKISEIDVNDEISENEISENEISEIDEINKNNKISENYEKNNSLSLFEKVKVASHRARQLYMGHQAIVEEETEHKPTIVALQELNDNLINREILKESIEINQSVEDLLTKAYAEESTEQT